MHAGRILPTLLLPECRFYMVILRWWWHHKCRDWCYSLLWEGCLFYCWKYWSNAYSETTHELASPSWYTLQLPKLMSTPAPTQWLYLRAQLVHFKLTLIILLSHFWWWSEMHQCFVLSLAGSFSLIHMFPSCWLRLISFFLVVTKEINCDQFLVIFLYGLVLLSTVCLCMSVC